MNKPHKHAQLLLAYAQDAQETETPWERWQIREAGHLWADLVCHPGWQLNFEYRRKPRVIVINGIEVPEPMREKPERGTMYFTPYIITGFAFATDAIFDDCTIDMDRLNAGLCHATREAADLHAKALLSFTKKEAK